MMVCHDHDPGMYNQGQNQSHDIYKNLLWGQGPMEGNLNFFLVVQKSKLCVIASLCQILAVDMLRNLDKLFTELNIKDGQSVLLFWSSHIGTFHTFDLQPPILSEFSGVNRPRVHVTVGWWISQMINVFKQMLLSCTLKYLLLKG